MRFPPATAIHALLFDLDGTLYRHGPVQRRIIARLAAAYWNRPQEAIRVLRVLTAYRRALEVLRHRPADCDLRDAQIRYAADASGQPAHFVTSSVSRWMETEPLDCLFSAMQNGVLEFLHEARQHGLKLAICSDYPASEKLAAMNLTGYFDAVAWAQSPEVQRFKPDKRMIDRVLDTLGVKPENAVLLGDRAEVDGAAAAAAGIGFVLIDRRSVYLDLLAELRSLPRPEFATGV